MFDGEKASLEAILSTNTVRCPKPVAVVDNPTGQGTIFIMEHLDIHGLSKHSAALGEQLARYLQTSPFLPQGLHMIQLSYNCLECILNATQCSSFLQHLCV